MSTLTPVRPSLRGPARVGVRQHRWTLWIAGGIALAAVIGMIALALRSSHVAEVFEATDCRVDGGAGRACDQTTRNYLDSMVTYRRMFDYVASGLTVLPVLFSAFVAGPLIARELESGTFRMAWTQSVSPTRWLVAKLAVPTMLLLAVTAVVTAVLARARSYGDTPYPVHWHDAYTFSGSGVLPLAHVMFGTAVGALTALLIRRVIPALTVSAFVTGAAVTFFTYWRAELWPSRTVSGTTLNAKEGMWWVETGHITGAGERLPQDVCASGASATDYARCMADHDVTSHYLDYHPASHFWPLQLVETGILLVLAAVALAVAFRVLRRLHG
ncbi:ABC transporter permease [Streptomyces sp. NBC_01460]|uniref:hypothetical protein n=1 Tax=Streptomyces sp. NBC_01460 TaxID=2903875 RepID=UPI002E34FDDE|nr:hypothetical protein [Streptomyces sp. NBC_01460]